MLNNTLHIPDFLQPVVTAMWLANVVNTSQHLDGLFIDQGKWCSSFVCKNDPDVYPAGKLDAWTHAHWDMLLELRCAIPDQILVLSNLNVTDFPAGFDHEYEKFTGMLDQFKSLPLDAVAGRVTTCHNTAHVTTTLPLFLLGAGSQGVDEQYQRHLTLLFV